MIHVRIDPKGFTRVRSKLQALRLSDADKAGPLLIEMDKAHIGQVKHAFTSKGRSVPSGPWPPLNPRYARWKKSKVGRKGILRFTDEFYDKATKPTKAGHIRRFIRPFTYQFGFADEKGWRHQHGVSAHRNVLPVRSVIDKDAEDYALFRITLVGFYSKRIRQVLRAAGFSQGTR